MAYETFNKKGKMSSMKKVRDAHYENDVSPSHMYAATEFGQGRPNSSRRITNNYGKTAGKRADYKPEVGNRSSTAGRMFNAIKDGVSRYRGY